MGFPFCNALLPMNRFPVLAFLLAAVTSTVVAKTPADAATIAVAHNLQQDAALARRTGKPLLIVFTAPDCGYCDRVIDYYLKPMQREPAAKRTAVIRQMDLTGIGPLVDFAGKATTPADYARRLDVTFAPTVIVFTPDGTPAGRRLVGLSSEDYYGGYMDAAIAAGRSAMRTSGVR
jgi:thioredoxin-related protein